MCGGTQPFPFPAQLHRGLSPRVRGNPQRKIYIVPQPGSIPACAGEPRPCTRRGTRPAVYPRVCGGTHLQAERQGRAPGLSPRVRGNLARARRNLDSSGSIPACAGEPHPHDHRDYLQTVYPRVCGGTHNLYAKVAIVVGLSPRVRGNPINYAFAPAPSRSIPACAGEPRPPAMQRPVVQVYPRVCGGTPATG